MIPIPAFGLRKFQGLIGTGFAQPKRSGPIPESVATRSITPGTMIVPIMSMWGSGFTVTRPSERAVGSPRRSAAQPWADSWSVIAKIMGKA